MTPTGYGIIFAVGLFLGMPLLLEAGGALAFGDWPRILKERGRVSA
jgi:hypothetical protein